MECENLKRVDLVEGESLHETIAALHLQEWRNNMNAVIDYINVELPDADAGHYDYDDGDGDEDDSDDEEGEKARAIRRWIRNVLRCIIHFQEEHQRYLNEEVGPTLQLVLHQDLVMNNVLPFLALPVHTHED